VVKVSKNLFNGQFNTGWGISSGTGEIQSFEDRKSFYIKVDPTKTYTISRSAVGSSTYFYYGTYAQQPYSNSQQCVSFGNIGINALTGTITIPTGANYLAFFFGMGESPNTQVELGSTATPYHPYGPIYVDGTTETVKVTGKNLFDSTPYKTGYYIDANGQEQAAVQLQDEYIIRQAIVQPSTTYTISFVGTIANYTQRFHAYDKNGDWILQIMSRAASPGETVTYTFTTPANCKYIRQGGRSQSNYQIELGSTATTYESYFNGGTATAEMLLKVGNYQDVQSVIDGNVTRNVAIKVLDGTENWQNLSSYINISKADLGSDSTVMPSNSTNIICSHFETKTGTFTDGIGIGGSYVNFKYDSLFTTLTQWKQWLASQYNAGTPVIVVYPLATATTETVTAQPLSIQAGTNIVEITQASIDNLPLEVSYKSTI
jgi:hypothetical protein